VGVSCTISVTFSPTGSGHRESPVTILDDAAGSPHKVVVTGTGNPVFSLSANARSNVVEIGTTSTTFTVSASAPNSFTDAIALTCSGITCQFDPTPIIAGESSALTVAGLSATSANPTNLTVSGTSGGQTANLSLAVFFADFSVSATPAVNSVKAGGSATYGVTVTPSNGFNDVVMLACSNLPQDTTCAWSPPGMTLNGTTPASATVTVTTTAQSARSAPPPKGGGDLHLGLKPRLDMCVLLLAILAFLVTTMASRRWAQGTTMRRIPIHLRFVTLVMVLFLLAAQIGCNEYTQLNLTTPTQTGTPTGNYTIVITGKLGNTSGVLRQTTVNLAVSP